MSCLLAMFLFLNSHPERQIGWVMGDGKTWGYTWAQDHDTGLVQYWAFNHGPGDSRVPLRFAGTCVLEGQRYDILRAQGRNSP